MYEQQNTEMREPEISEGPENTKVKFEQKPLLEDQIIRL